MGQQRGVFREPGPVHAVEDCMCEFDDVAILKVLAAGKDAAEQDRGIDGRDFGVPDSFAGIDVGEVIEESAMRRQLPPKKYECRNDAQARVLVGDEAALFCNADCGQAKTGGRDACDYAGVLDARTLQRSLINPVCGLACSQKKRKAAAFQIVKKLIILRRKGGRRREGAGAGSLCRLSAWCCAGACAHTGRAFHGASGRPSETPAIWRSSWRREVRFCAGRLFCEFVLRYFRRFHLHFHPCSFRPSIIRPGN